MDATGEFVGVRRTVLEQIKQTEMDSELQSVLIYIKDNWPDHIKSAAKSYFHQHGSMSELNGVLRCGN